MKQQTNWEEKSVKLFHVENMLRNKYGLNNNLSKIVSKLFVDFSEDVYESYDFKKIKMLKNAQSNLNFRIPKINVETKITFYIGLMDKDDLSYKYSKAEAITKVIDVLGNCTIQKAVGFFTRNDGKQVQVDTLIAIQYLKEYDGNYIHYKAKELKKIFNQSSILTEENGQCLVEYNDETKEYEEEIEGLMKEYDWNWKIATSAAKTGI